MPNAYGDISMYVLTAWLSVLSANLQMVDVKDDVRDRQLDSLMRMLDKALREAYPTQDPADIYQMALKLLISYDRARAQGHAHNATQDQI